MARGREGRVAMCQGRPADLGTTRSRGKIGESIALPARRDRVGGYGTGGRVYTAPDLKGKSKAAEKSMACPEGVGVAQLPQGMA